MRVPHGTYYVPSTWNGYVFPIMLTSLILASTFIITAIALAIIYAIRRRRQRKYSLNWKDDKKCIKNGVFRKRKSFDEVGKELIDKVGLILGNYEEEFVKYPFSKTTCEIVDEVYQNCLSFYVQTGRTTGFYEPIRRAR